MKKLFSIFLFLFSSVSIWAQDYKPMLQNVNEWQFLTCFQGDCSLIDTYFTDGDTIVNNKQHKILDGFHYISREFLLREEVATKKVYLTTVIGGNIEEFLLYDFSLEIGDEFQMTNPYSPFPQDGGMFILFDIQELQLADGEMYRHYYFTPSPGNMQSPWEPIWVEGVGSLSIVTAPGGDPNFDEAGEVCCSFANGENIYANLEHINACNPVLGSEHNPELEGLSLQLDADTIKITGASDVQNVRLYDVYGRLVSTVNSIGNETIEISTLNVSRGLYIVVARGTNQAVKTFKVLLY